MAAALVAVGLTGTAVVATTGTAHAGTGAYINCSKPWGYQAPGHISIGLPALSAGHQAAIYLYKSVAGGSQYQNAMDWAVSGGNYGWSTNGSPAYGSLDVDTNGVHGFYYVWIHVWAPNGANTGAWSLNGCNF